jgi:hypothetical protein
VIHSDGWRGYDGLVDVGYSKHFRVLHSNNEFANEYSHINGIESFWSSAKRRLQKFNGIPAHTFYLHLKECEYRFNNRHKTCIGSCSHYLKTSTLDQLCYTRAKRDTRETFTRITRHNKQVDKFAYLRR